MGRARADGRLTTEELAGRTERAYAARTFGDLDALTADLPPIQPPAAAATPGSSASPAHPPAAGQAAARAALYRSLIWYGLLSAVLLVV